MAFGGLLTAGCSTPGAAPEGIRLSALQVTGGGMLYPSFSPGVRHYAMRCAAATTLRVTARAQGADHRVTLLHNNLTATGSVADSVTVNGDHDIAIEVGDGNSTATYYVHCIPPDFPDIRIEKRTAAVTDGLLLLTSQIIDPALIRAGRSPSVITFLAIVDNNGVPRWVRRSEFGARGLPAPRRRPLLPFRVGRCPMIDRFAVSEHRHEGHRAEGCFEHEAAPRSQRYPEDRLASGAPHPGELERRP